MCSVTHTLSLSLTMFSITHTLSLSHTHTYVYQTTLTRVWDLYFETHTHTNMCVSLKSNSICEMSSITHTLTHTRTRMDTRQKWLDVWDLFFDSHTHTRVCQAKVSRHMTYFPVWVSVCVLFWKICLTHTGKYVLCRLTHTGKWHIWHIFQNRTHMSYVDLKVSVLKVSIKSKSTYDI